MSRKTIDFTTYTPLTMAGFTVHVVKTMEDGYPTLGIRILCDDKEQRDQFIRERFFCEQRLERRSPKCYAFFLQCMQTARGPRQSARVIFEKFP